MAVSAVVLRATGRMIMGGGGAGGVGERDGGKRKTKEGEKEREDEKETKGRIPNLFYWDVLPYMFTVFPNSSLIFSCFTS